MEEQKMIVGKGEMAHPVKVVMTLKNRNGQDLRKVQNYKSGCVCRHKRPCHCFSTSGKMVSPEGVSLTLCIFHSGPTRKKECYTKGNNRFGYWDSMYRCYDTCEAEGKTRIAERNEIEKSLNMYVKEATMSRQVFDGKLPEFKAVRKRYRLAVSGVSKLRNELEMARDFAEKQPILEQIELAEKELLNLKSNLMKVLDALFYQAMRDSKNLERNISKLSGDLFERSVAIKEYYENFIEDVSEFIPAGNRNETFRKLKRKRQLEKEAMQKLKKELQTRNFS